MPSGASTATHIKDRRAFTAAALDLLVAALGVQFDQMESS